MPELPDVELFKRRLDETSLHRRIADVAVADARILDGFPASRFRDRLRGNSLEESHRHGKHLLVRLAKDGWLTLHFGMTGALQFFRGDEAEPRYTRVRLDFDGSHLAYVNMRMLGHVGLVADAEAFLQEQELGPDALDRRLDLRAFRAVLANSRGKLKSTLMDQSAIAGIGNIYSDEILFQAALHPEARAGQLSSDQQEKLYRAMRRVLETAIARGAGSEHFLERLPKGYLLPHRRKGGTCPRCGGPVKSIKAAGRTAYYCPKCQRAGPR